MKSIEELALKVAKEMYPDWHHDVTSRLLPAYATRLLATYTEQQGEVVVTTDEEGRCVAVTRQDEEGQILSVIWEAEQVPADMVLVPKSIHPLESSGMDGAMELLRNPPTPKVGHDATDYYADWWEQLIDAGGKKS